MSMLRRLILASLFLGGAASAESWRASYQITAAGVTVMEAEVTFDLGQDGAPYSIESRVRSRGLASLLFRGEQSSRSAGVLQGATLRPRQHESQGNWRGTPRRTVLTYAPDGLARIDLLEPVQDVERAPVRDEERRGALDTLSAIIRLTQQVRRTGRCDVQARTFDGRRLTQFDVTTDPIMRVSDNGLLRCLVESRPLGGFALDRPVEEATRPTQSVLLYGVPQPGAPAIPVRIEVASRWWGTIQATLTTLTAQ